VWFWEPGAGCAVRGGGEVVGYGIGAIGGGIGELV